MPAEPRRPTQAERKAATREQLVATASEVFVRRGYHRATVEEIAEQAGYSHGAVYSSFAGKDELFLAVFESYMMDRPVESIAALAEAPQGPGGKASALADLWMSRLSADPMEFVLHIEFFVHAARDPELSKKIGVRMAALRSALQRFLEEGAEELGLELPMPGAELALIMRAIGIGLAVEAINSPAEVREGVFADFTEVLFDSLAKTARPIDP